MWGRAMLRVRVRAANFIDEGRVAMVHALPRWDMRQRIARYTNTNTNTNPDKLHPNNTNPH